MARKPITIRVDQATAEQLKFRSRIEHRSVNHIVGEVIQEYIQSHPISRERMLEMVRSVVEEDDSLLNLLADA
jgi:hypothetical protein